MAIVGRCPLDKRVGCEALPTDRFWSVGKGGVGAKELNGPYRNNVRVGIVCVLGEVVEDGKEIWRWKAKDVKLVDKTKTTKLDKI